MATWAKRSANKRVSSKSRPINLTVHKNTIEKKQKRELAKDAQRRVERVIRECDLRAYAFVGIGADGSAYAVWDTGAIMPMWCFGGAMASILQCDMENEIEGDDWKPPLVSGK